MAPTVLVAMLTVVIACPDHDSRLDDAISQYVTQRKAEVQAGCKCYHLFLNPSGFDKGMFTSEEECLEILWPAQEVDVASCVKSVLASSSYDTKGSIDIMECYTELIAAKTDCYEQNAGECSQTACSSDIDKRDKCQGNLTDTEVQALYYCAVQ